MKNKKQKYLIFIALVLLVGIGYAALTSNLRILGFANIKSNNFDIHFENVTYNSNNVFINTTLGEYNATIDTNDNTKVNYSVSLSKPGDFYEFTVDVVNSGTLEGQLATNTSTLKINNDEPFVIEEDGSNLPDYLEYNLTYLNGTLIEENHTLESGEKVTYKVRIKFKEDIEPEDLPKEVKTLSFGLRSMFIQAPKAAATLPEPETYNNYLVNNTVIEIGGNIPDGFNIRSDADDAMNDWIQLAGNTRPFYLNLTLQGKEVKDIILEFVVTETLANKNVGMIPGTYQLKFAKGQDCTYENYYGYEEVESCAINSAYYAENVNTMKKAFDYQHYNNRCSDGNTDFEYGCDVPGLSVLASIDGYIHAISYEYSMCYIDIDGTARCYKQ